MPIIRVLNRFICGRVSIIPPTVRATVFLMLFTMTGACAAEGQTPEGQTPEDKGASFRTVEWTDLIPKDDLEALLSPPQAITDIKDGAWEDQINNQLLNSLATASDDRYQQALVSTRVVAEMDGKAIRIPGFVVPLEYTDGQAITQFFLVPYFGACIHVPPPPPNQIILVNYPQGMTFKDIDDPLWISGVVKTSIQENDLATAAYVMDMAQFEAYTE